MKPEDIKVDHYYKTPNNQHRHVIEIEDGKVHYMSRGQNGGEWSLGHNKTTPPSLETFAAAVDKEVDANWTSSK